MLCGVVPLLPGTDYTTITAFNIQVYQYIFSKRFTTLPKIGSSVEPNTLVAISGRSVRGTACSDKVDLRPKSCTSLSDRE